MWMHKSFIFVVRNEQGYLEVTLKLGGLYEASSIQYLQLKVSVQ